MKGTASCASTEAGGGSSPPANGYPFLTPDRIREVFRLVQCDRRCNQSFRRLTGAFTLIPAYVIEVLPGEWQAHYQGADQAVTFFFVQVNNGSVRRFHISPQRPAEKMDFTIFSDYTAARRIFQGELTPGSSFINRLVRVEPLKKLCRNPKFAARSFVAGNLITEICTARARGLPAGVIVPRLRQPWRT